MLQIWSKMKFLSALYHMGVKYVKKVLGTGRDGQLTQINVKFWKNWSTLLGPGRFSKDFIPTSIILKGYFIPIKFGAAQTRCIFEVWGHCAAPDWACRKNPWSISYLWTKICWKQFWPGQLFWIDDPYWSYYPFEDWLFMIIWANHCSIRGAGMSGFNKRTIALYLGKSQDCIVVAKQLKRRIKFQDSKNKLWRFLRSTNRYKPRNQSNGQETIK